MATHMFQQKNKANTKEVKRDGGLCSGEGKDDESFQKHQICIFRGKARDGGEARGSLSVQLRTQEVTAINSYKDHWRKQR